MAFAPLPLGGGQLARAATVLLLASASSPRLKGQFISELQPGQSLRGKVVERHRDKLYLQVPVDRMAAGGFRRPVHAQLAVPAGEQMAPLGASLTVYVERAQPESGRLSVSLERLKPKVAATGLSRRERALAASDCPHRLEELKPGDPLRGVVLSVHSHGYYLDVGVSRAGKGGARKAVDALLPFDNGGLGERRLEVGSELDVLALRPQPRNGRLSVSADTSLTAEAIGEAQQARLVETSRRGRRPSLASLASQVGSEREGTVVRFSAAGAVVNVGAAKPGLIHLSQLRAGRGRRSGWVDDPSDLLDIGDRVVCRILPRSDASRLCLQLVKVFPRKGEAIDTQTRALQRRGEALRPKFKRAEDRARPPKQKPPVAASDEDDPFAWAAAGADEGDDPFAWAAGSAEEEEAVVEVVEKEEKEDPFAWAAAGADDSDVDGDVDGGGGSDDDDDPFSEDYFLDNYEQDSY